jgi:hypothetical protein
LPAAGRPDESYHEPLAKLSAKYAAKGHPELDILALLERHMLVSDARSERWKDRYDDLARGMNLARPHTTERRGFDGQPVQLLELAELNSAGLAHELNGLINFRSLDKKRFVPADCQQSQHRQFFRFPTVGVHYPSWT